MIENEKPEGVRLDRELVQVVADGGELPHHIVEPVVRLFLRLKAAHQKAEQRRLGQAGALGFLLQLLRFVTGEPKLFFDRPLHLSSPSLLLICVSLLRIICTRHIARSAMMPPSSKPIIKKSNSCIGFSFLAGGIRGSPNEDFLRRFEKTE